MISSHCRVDQSPQTRSDVFISVPIDITNIEDITNFACMGIPIFSIFQIACPRKWCGHFRSNSTKLNYSSVLHIDGVTASVLISVPLCMPCEHGENQVKKHTFCTVVVQL